MACRRVQPRRPRLEAALSRRVSSRPAPRLDPLRLAEGPRAAAYRPERRERLAQQRREALPESAAAYRLALLARWAQRRRQEGSAKACRQGPPARWAQRRPQEGSAEAFHPERREQQASQRSLAA